MNSLTCRNLHRTFISSTSKLIVALSILAGCGGDSAATAKVADKSVAATPTATLATDLAKSPKYESELFITHTSNGGTATSSNKTTRYTDGKQFSAVEGCTSTFRGDKQTVKIKVKFIEHKDGADMFSVESEIEGPTGAQQTSTTVPYIGEKKTILENKVATVVLQPPSK